MHHAPAFGLLMDPAVPQEKLAQAMLSAQPIREGIFADADQVSRGSLRSGRHANLRQLSRPIQPGQFLRVTPIGFHPIARTARDKRWITTVLCPN
jgi:hypothetical protein